MQQLLNVSLNDTATFDNFYVTDKNQQLLTCLSDTKHPLIYLWGRVGSGRTHLLQACCQRASSKRIPSMYLPLDDVGQLTPDVLYGIENIPLLCLDNIDGLSGHCKWQEALFHAYNIAIDNHTKLIVSSHCAPHELAFTLADLQSRLASGVTFQLHALQDDEKVLALQLRAQQKGFEFSADAANYLMNHYSRDTRSLFGLLDDLDKASLIAKRRITIPFLKSVLLTTGKKQKT